MTAARFLWVAVVASCIIPGCGLFEKPQTDDTQKRLIQLQEDNRKLKEQSDGLVADLVDKRKQIDSLIGLGSRRMELITHAESIELGDYTAPFNPDGLSKAPNAVKVYLLPKDAQGSIVKAAGALEVKLFDLNAADGKNLIGHCAFAPEQMAKNWYSGFMAMTYHYSFVCPWERAPTKGEVLVRVEFTDYLTGKHFTATKTVNITQPASQPGK